MNKLAFFVGAGVSKLSGFPPWFELVKSMGDELNYNYKKLMIAMVIDLSTFAKVSF